MFDEILQLKSPRGGGDRGLGVKCGGWIGRSSSKEKCFMSGHVSIGTIFAE